MRGDRAGAGIIGLALALVVAGWIGPARAAQDRDPAQACLTAAATAARAENVPPDVLVTVALVESGRDSGAGLAPWAWAVHAEGRGHWPATRTAARAIAQTALEAGQRNFDLGCFQINYHWHGAQFANLDAMLDPVTNARYAARLLRGHYDRLGSWPAAVGAYHSRTPELAERYVARFDRLLSHAPALPPAPTPATAGAIALHLATDTRPLVDLRGARP